MNDWTLLDYGVFIVLPICAVAVAVLLPIMFVQARTRARQRERIAFLEGQGSVFERMNPDSDRTTAERYEDLAERHNALAIEYDEQSKRETRPLIANAYAQMANADRAIASAMRSIHVDSDSILDASEIE